MEDTSIGGQIAALVILIILSAVFSASETAMMSLNRYRLKYLANNGSRGARLAMELLEKPDRLLSLILLGNNLVNFGAAAIASIVAFKIAGEWGVTFATFFMAFAVLIIAEVPPKTLAAVYPEKIGLPAAYLLTVLIRVGSPFVWLINKASNGVLRLFGISIGLKDDELTAAELRTIVLESGARLPLKHQEMLLRILELEHMAVEDVMVPRARIEAVDLDGDWDEVIHQLGTAHHSRIPVYRESLDNLVGVIHLRKLLLPMQDDEFDMGQLLNLVRKPYFVPEGSRLTDQLLALQAEKRQMGLVVDEYGDIKGLVTVKEIVEEIVGEFTSNNPVIGDDLESKADGSYIVDGGVFVRDFNRKTGWELPVDGPKTLNGLILETLEDIPEPGTSVLLHGHPVEIMQTQGSGVSILRIQQQRD